MQGELPPERVRVVRQESLIAKGLEDKLQQLLLAESDVEHVMEGTANLARAAERGEEPDFSWVPDRLRVQVMSEWSGARERIVSFKDAQQEQQAERVAELSEEIEDLELKEAAERAAKLEELEEKFGPIPGEVGPLSAESSPIHHVREMRRPIAAEPTMVIPRPKRQTFFQKMLERARGKKSE